MRPLAVFLVLMALVAACTADAPLEAGATPPVNQPYRDPPQAAATTAVGATAAYHSFSLLPVVNKNCDTTCAAKGLRSLNGGISGHAACMRNGRYGTWVLRASSGQANGPGMACYYSSLNGNGYYAQSGYTCVCIPKGESTTVAWRADPACAKAPQAAAVDPALCRFQKLGGGNWWMGWLVGKTCYTSRIKFGPGGQTIRGVIGWGGTYRMQALCKTGTSAGSLPYKMFTVAGASCSAWEKKAKAAYIRGLAKFLGKATQGFTATCKAHAADRRRRTLLAEDQPQQELTFNVPLANNEEKPKIKEKLDNAGLPLLQDIDKELTAVNEPSFNPSYADRGHCAPCEPGMVLDFVGTRFCGYKPCDDIDRRSGFCFPYC